MEEYEFENQRSDEEVILVGKRHPWVLIKSVLFLILLAVCTLFSFLIWGASRNSVVVLIAALVIAVIYLLIRFFIYNNDIYIITNQRVINIDQSGFFSRKVSEAELENIQNVTYEIHGPVNSLLNFGDIEVSTAGNTSGLRFKNITNPHFIQEKIVHLQKQAKASTQIPIIR